ncbi:hypothetical protein B0J17DRAFT_710778 [Rhizoctonia solani]|nr:hypothetical protein B0J17DRAFT_710778 [Rhizoctonia solani]
MPSLSKVNIVFQLIANYHTGAPLTLSALSAYKPLPDWVLQVLEGIEDLPSLTLNVTYSEMNTMFWHFFPAASPHCWKSKPRSPICQVATPDTEDRFTDEYHREVDGNVGICTLEFVISEGVDVYNEIVRFVVSIVGTEGSEDKGFKRLENWTKRLYEGLDDAHDVNVLEGMLVTGVFAQSFDIVKEGESVKLAPASKKMSIKSSEFHDYLHMVSRET